jgi:hypothetical protein
LTRASTSPAARRPRADGSPSRARPPRAGRSSRRPGRPSSSQGPCARSTSASAAGAAARSPRRRRAQARGAVLAPAVARRGLRPRPAVADGQEAAPARDPRRRADAQGQADRDLGDAPADAHGRARARPAGRGLLPADRRGLAGRGKEGGRERDSGARIDQALEGQRRAAGPRAPDACSSTRHRLAPTTQPSAAHPTSRPRRRPRARKIRPKSPDRDRCPPNRPHRTRSKALGEASATDPSSEISPNSVKASPTDP